MANSDHLVCGPSDPHLMERVGYQFLHLRSMQLGRALPPESLQWLLCIMQQLIALSNQDMLGLTCGISALDLVASEPTLNTTYWRIIAKLLSKYLFCFRIFCFFRTKSKVVDQGTLESSFFF